MMRYIVLLVLLSLTANVCGQTYEGLITKSYDYLDKSELDSAEVSLKAAMQMEPSNPMNFALLTNLGTIQRRLGKREDALLSYTAALAQKTNNTTILMNRASLYAEMDDLEKAIADYTTVLMHDAKNEEALYERGLAYIQDSDFFKAEDDFSKILELNETSTLGRLGHAILEKERGNYNESERIFNYLIDKLPREWLLYQERADLYFRMGKNGRAMADLNRVFIESKPTAWTYLLRGKVKLAQYEKSSAAQDFEKAKEMGYDPEVINAYLALTKKK